MAADNLPSVDGYLAGKQRYGLRQCCRLSGTGPSVHAPFSDGRAGGYPVKMEGNRRVMTSGAAEASPGASDGGTAIGETNDEGGGTRRTCPNATEGNGQLVGISRGGRRGANANERGHWAGEYSSATIVLILVVGSGGPDDAWQ